MEDYPPQESLSAAGQVYAAEVMRRGTGVAAEDHSYGPDPYQSVALSLPKKPNGTVLAVVHGGGWTSGYKGFGAVFATATYVGGPKNGTFSECGTAYLDNGDGLSGIGQGTYESKGKHQWRTESFMQISDGRRVRGEGEINLASRSWKGQLFEMS
jgi:hypothetical protein